MIETSGVIEKEQGNGFYLVTLEQPEGHQCLCRAAGKLTKFKISIEAGTGDCWKKYVGSSGITFGIEEFGKSAPYKDIFKHFGLTVSNVASTTRKILRN